MYRVYSDGNLIYDPRVANKDDGYMLFEPALTLGVGSAGHMVFKIHATHPNIDRIKRMESVIAVYDGEQLIFRGRVIRDSVNFRGMHEVEVEGLGASLNDSIQPPFNYPVDYLTDADYQEAAASGNVIAFFLSQILAKHNRQVGENQQVQLGTVTVTDINNYIARSAQDPAKTLDTIIDKLTSSALGGYFLFRYEESGTYLDYLSSFTTENTQEVIFAENLLEFSDETYGGDLYTAIYPVGKDGLTISALQDITYSGYVKDGAMLYDPVASGRYGRITKIIEWSDVTLPENLLAKAIRNLQDLSGVMPKSLTVSAVDLSAANNEQNSFKPGKKVHVISKPHGYEEFYPVMEVVINLTNPAETTLNLSKEDETYTSSLQGYKDSVNVVLNEIKGTVTETNEDLGERISITESKLLQDADNITAMLAQIDDLTQQLTEVRATADGLLVQITNIEQNGVESVRTRTGYTFDIDGLKISKEGEEMQNKLDNTGLYVTRSGEQILTANNEGVEAINLTAHNFLIIGRNSRLQDYDNGSDHYRTAIFYTGPNV